MMIRGPGAKVLMHKIKEKTDSSRRSQEEAPTYTPGPSLTHRHRLPRGLRLHITTPGTGADDRAAWWARMMLCHVTPWLGAPIQLDWVMTQD